MFNSNPTVPMQVTVALVGDGQRRLEEDCGPFNIKPGHETTLDELVLKDMVYALFEKGWNVKLNRTKGDYSHVTLTCGIKPLE